MSFCWLRCGKCKCKCSRHDVVHLTVWNWAFGSMLANKCSLSCPRHHPDQEHLNLFPKRWKNESLVTNPPALRVPSAIEFLHRSRVHLHLWVMCGQKGYDNESILVEVWPKSIKSSVYRHENKKQWSKSCIVSRNLLLSCAFSVQLTYITDIRFIMGYSKETRVKLIIWTLNNWGWSNIDIFL